MNAIDGRALELEDIMPLTPAELADAALTWVGQIRVDANTHSAVCKQASVDLLSMLKYRLGEQGPG